ncbi:MAG: M23 family metallopeptidase [Betaproteobacteria bacterium]|nr:M23 family metallopeptidase [Betaproteobacteria bacterium]
MSKRERANQMQLIITDAWLAKSRALHLSGTKLLGAMVLASFVLMLVAAGLYHWVFLKGAREGWPVVGTLVRLMVKDEFDQRDRFMRENLDVLARRVGELQAKLRQLESLGERVSGLAGMSPNDIKAKPGQGGALVSGRPLSVQELEVTLADLDRLTGQRTDWMTVMESRLVDQKVRAMMVPTRQPVVSGNLGSLFGWRIDPITGTSALHTGLDYPAEPGTPIFAAAGGVVVVQEFNAPYGNMIEIDHGNDLITRYAHASRVFVNRGDLIRVGQKIAEVGSTGRSTGPHLHFEVLVQGIPQDPMKFLAAGKAGSAPSSNRSVASNHAVPANRSGRLPVQR